MRTLPWSWAHSAVILLGAPPIVLALVFVGCGGGTPPPTTAEAGTASSTPEASTMGAEASVMSTESGNLTLDAGTPDASSQVTATDTGAGAADSGAPCWKGFTPTGNAVADLGELGNRCAKGMAQLIPPLKYNFKTGETKTIPIPFVAGCYRIIAVGGAGVKDVDLALKDSAGKIVTADLTNDDVIPMIHPNHEWCTDAVQILNLNIIVKKGAGEVAGGAWKR